MNSQYSNFILLIQIFAGFINCGCKRGSAPVVFYIFKYYIVVTMAFHWTILTYLIFSNGNCTYKFESSDLANQYLLNIYYVKYSTRIKKYLPKRQKKKLTKKKKNKTTKNLSSTNTIVNHQFFTFSNTIFNYYYV